MLDISDRSMDGPDPRVLSRTKQEFGGKRYYLCGPYFQRDGKRLHVAVWEAANGKRPPGYEIHHVDENKSHNVLSNLECKPKEVHRSQHGKRFWETSRAFRKNIKCAQDAAREWHGTEAGLKFHRRNGARTAGMAKAHPVGKACEQCEALFLDHSLGRRGRFCSAPCSAAWRRASGLDDEDRRCVACRCTFRVNRYSKQANCSADCGRRTRAVAHG